MDNEMITRKEIREYKREILESSVLVRLDEAAEMLSVSRTTILRRVDEGRLSAYSDNSTSKGLRFLASELQSYVRQMRKTQNMG
jgi:excisionase family DNA binding protein